MKNYSRKTNRRRTRYRTPSRLRALKSFRAVSTVPHRKKMERFFDDSFFRLPFPKIGWDLAVNAENASAEFENGALKVTLPKKEKSQPNKIPVRVKK